MSDKYAYNLIPGLRFPDFICDKEWKELLFGKLFTFLPNNTLSRADLKEGEGDVNNVHYGDVLIKLNAYTDIQQGRLPAIKNVADISKYQNARLQDGDIVIADTAEDETVGKCTEIFNTQETIVVSGLHTIPCRPRIKFAQAFLGYYMNSSSFHNRLRHIMQGVKVTSISKTALQNIYLTFPESFEEQQKIADCLSSIDSYISSINEKIEQLKAHKKSLMQKLFPQNGKTVPEYRFPEFEKDEGWTEKRLGDFLKIRNGYAFKSNTYITSGKFKIVTIRNVKKGRLEMGEYNTINNLPTDIQPHQILKRGNILVSMTGNVGRVCKVDCDNCLQNQRVGLIEKYTTTIDEDFVFTILTDTCFEQAMIESGQGAAQTNIGNKDIEDYSFLCPPSLSEQNQIALCLSPIESLTSYYMDKIALLEQFMVGLTQQLFPKQQAL